MMSLDLATRLIDEAVAEAGARSLGLSFAVTDGAGIVVAAARTDAAPPATIEVAMAKARCAATFRRPTQVFEQRSISGEPGVVTLPGVVALAGGVPVVVDGVVIGAIGVSGSAPAIDHEVGAAVIGRIDRLA
ncbi:MAG: heme-binding protein [Rhodocyclaceae bacterium]|nr:heme-binding protein [Rhodocyclaceae bacterium]